MRQQQRRRRVQAERLVDDALEVAEARQVVRVDEAGGAHGGVDLGLRLLELLRVVEQERHGPFRRGRRCLRPGAKQILRGEKKEKTTVGVSGRWHCWLKLNHSGKQDSDVCW